jgi:hypothetical protein
MSSGLAGVLDLVYAQPLARLQPIRRAGDLRAHPLEIPEKVSVQGLWQSASKNLSTSCSLVLSEFQAFDVRFDQG